MEFQCNHDIPVKLPSIHQLVSDVAPASRVLRSLKESESGDETEECSQKKTLKQGDEVARGEQNSIATTSHHDVGPTGPSPSMLKMPNPRETKTYFPTDSKDRSIYSNTLGERGASLRPKCLETLPSDERHGSGVRDKVPLNSYFTIPVYTCAHMDTPHVPQKADVQDLRTGCDEIHHIPLPAPPRIKQSDIEAKQHDLPSVSSIFRTVPPINVVGPSCEVKRSQDGTSLSARDIKHELDVENARRLHAEARSVQQQKATPSGATNSAQILLNQPMRFPLPEAGWTKQDSLHSPAAYVDGSRSYIMGMDHDGPKRRGNLPKPVTHILRTWLQDHLDHPYPSDEDKQGLMGQTGLSLVQISNWFINARRRALPQSHRKGKGRGRVRGGINQITTKWQPSSPIQDRQAH